MEVMERERRIMVMIGQQETRKTSNLLKIVPSSEESSEQPMKIARERALLQELGSANARLLQLERTIKWWSECTATWREKWGRVRIQRNELRDECKVLKGRNEALIMEFQKLQNQNEMFWGEIEKLRLEKRTAVVGPLTQRENCNNSRNFNEGVSIVDVPPSNIAIKIEHIKSKHTEQVYFENERKEMTDNFMEDSQFSIPGFLQDMIFIENLLAGDTKQDSPQIPCSSTSKNRTDHVTNAIIIEKLTKLKEYVKSCEAFVATKESESVVLKANLVELQTSKCEILKKYEELKQLKEPCSDIKNGQGAAERKIRDLHTEIQRLQQENCNEWTKREQCETDMAELKRELRHIHQNKTELEEELAKKSEELRTSHTTERKLLNEELDAKSHELTEAKSLCNKSRRQLQEKTDELTHEKKRTEHLDSEVKKLRTRIDELKKQVLVGEENIDHQGNQVRRLQRSLDEQIGQTETLQAELKHASMRFKRQSMVLTCQSEESISDEN